MSNKLLPNIRDYVSRHKSAPPLEDKTTVALVSNRAQLDTTAMKLKSLPLSAAASDTFSQLNEWYDDNKDALIDASSSLATMDVKAIDTALLSLRESTAVVMKGLELLSQIHPAIGVAVIAFELVITLEMGRRDNNRKVLALKLQMQDTLLVLFHLRHIKNPNQIGPDGSSLQDRLRGLMEKIAEDIRETGSVCDHYLKKSFLAKTLKAKIYEERLARHGGIFTQHRKDLHFELSMHTAISIDHANAKLDDVQLQMEQVAERVDLLVLFRLLDTPRERDMLNFIDAKGGPERCVNNPQLLQELIEKSGDGIPGVLGTDSDLRGEDSFQAAKRTLSKELSEDVDDALQRNYKLFEKKLDFQKRQLDSVKQTFQQESQKIIKTILSGAYDRIVDPDMRAIWKEMGWKGSVKARHLVLAIHDYFIAKFGEDDGDDLADSPISLKQTRNIMADDRWTLAYINMLHVQPIMEAIDDNATGFININEVNVFTTSRPPGWTLLHWLAYWSQGWHRTVETYRNKLYMLLQMISTCIATVLPLNKMHADRYFNYWTYHRIELILRSTQTVKQSLPEDRALDKLSRQYVLEEEQRLASNLDNFGYEVDDLNTLQLISGPGRVERYVYPVLYLVLKRQYATLTHAQTHVLDKEEFDAMNHTLEMIVNALDKRVDALEAVFKQTSHDVRARFKTFSFGMMELSVDPVWAPSENSLSRWVDSDDSGATQRQVTEDLTNETNLPLDSVLKYPTHDSTASKWHNDDFGQGTSKDSSSNNHPEVQHIRGLWSGYLFNNIRCGNGLAQLYVEPNPEVTEQTVVLSGQARSYAGMMTFTGSYSLVDQSLSFKLEYRDGFADSCEGTLDVSREMMRGSYANTSGHGDDSSDEDSSDDEGVSLSRTGTQASRSPPTFAFHRTPVELLRFRYVALQLTTDPVRAHWSFALSAVLYRVRQTRPTWRFIQSVLSRQRRLIDLLVRFIIFTEMYTPFQSLDVKDMMELDHFKAELPPHDMGFYIACARDKVMRLSHFPDVDCASCERFVIQSDFICAECVNKTYSEGLDLCLMCKDAPLEEDGYKHLPTHAMVKIENFIHDGPFAWVMPEAVAMANRIRELFEVLEVPLSVDGSTVIGRRNRPACTYCDIYIRLPCWACVYCTPDTFICLECEKAGPGTSLEPDHSKVHALVRIADSAEVVNSEPTLSELKDRIVALENNVDQRLKSMEAMMAEILRNQRVPHQEVAT